LHSFLVIYLCMLSEVVRLSGTGETLILSIRKDINDGSEEDCCKGRKDTSALHR